MQSNRDNNQNPPELSLPSWLQERRGPRQGYGYSKTRNLYFYCTPEDKNKNDPRPLLWVIDRENKATIEEIIKNDDYSNFYIYLKNHQSLFFIKKEKNFEEIKIRDLEKFEKNLKEIMENELRFPKTIKIQ